MSQGAHVPPYLTLIQSTSMRSKDRGSGGGLGRGRGRPPISSYASISDSSVATAPQSLNTQQPPATPLRGAVRAQGYATTTRRTRRTSGPLEEMQDNPDRIMRSASKTPSRRSSVASNDSRVIDFLLLGKSIRICQ